MRQLIAVWIVLAVVMLGALTNCSVTHKSDGFACPDGTCADGRSCVDGFCVVTGDVPDANTGGRKDANTGSGKDAPDDQCPDQCTSCDLGTNTCIIDCKQPNSMCGGNLECPEGFNCDVRCNTQGACSHGLNCSKGESCKITCEGQGSCRGVNCGAGTCDIQCTGTNSCRNVSCAQSCACDIACGDASLCENVTCPSFQCSEIGTGGCSSTNVGCDTCP